MDKQQLKKAAIYLKCGEYDGTHIMTGWIACNELIKAQDRIAELEAELKAREWVSVEDDLPEHATWVLVVAVKITNKLPMTTMAFFEEGIEGESYWLEHNDSDQEWSNVTKWQPLPSPPEKDNND